MIRIDDIGFVPAFNYAEYSYNELSRGLDYVPMIEQASEHIWVVSKGRTPLFVVGVIRSSLLAPARLWFLLCEDFLETSRYWALRAIRRLVRLLANAGYAQVQTLVEAEWDVGQRFAKFCGFRPTGLTETTLGRDYLVLERK